MPSKNLQKDYVEDTYYHVYNRGSNKSEVFVDQQDYAVFLNLLKRYLDKNPSKDLKGREYETLYGRVELLAFCLMPNHFHLLLYQYDTEAMQRLARGVFTSYTTYFNKKYNRIGPLFQARYKASRIVEENYLLHISRYIHLNPQQYENWNFSSLPYYLREKKVAWIKPEKILSLFDSKAQYNNFLKDHADHKYALKTIKHILADQ